MKRDELRFAIEEFSDNSPLNYLNDSLDEVEANNYLKNNLQGCRKSAESLLEVATGVLNGMRFFQRPIFSIACAEDVKFKRIKRLEVVGEHHLLPKDWLPDAKTVISIFLPIERSTVETNKKKPGEPSLEWLCTRIDGQRFLLALGVMVRDLLIAEGYKAVTPATEDKMKTRGSDKTVPDEFAHIPRYSSNWSERHVAFASGLGTFGLSTNFISKAGCAGRLVSVISNWDIEPDEPDYDDRLGYCNRCGACKKRCPAEAYCGEGIGKDYDKCSAFIEKIRTKYGPRYGCGKCQSGVPCEFKSMKLQKV